jgi:hypothetical protein
MARELAESSAPLNISYLVLHIQLLHRLVHLLYPSTIRQRRHRPMSSRSRILTALVLLLLLFLFRRWVGFLLDLLPFSACLELFLYRIEKVEERCCYAGFEELRG